MQQQYREIVRFFHLILTLLSRVQHSILNTKKFSCEQVTIRVWSELLWCRRLPWKTKHCLDLGCNNSCISVQLWYVHVNA